MGEIIYFFKLKLGKEGQKWLFLSLNEFCDYISTKNILYYIIEKNFTTFI